MRRRLALCAPIVFALGLAVAAAEEPRPRVIGVLLQGGPYLAGVTGLREGLVAAGLEEGRHFRFVVREGRGDLAVVEAAAKDFERDAVDLIVTMATSVSVAAKRATQRVPIVFIAGSDPVAFGLVDSVARPGGRLTGIVSITGDLSAKRLELLRELMPKLRRVITFYHATNPVTRRNVELARAAAKQLGIELVERQVTSSADVDRQLAALTPGDAEAFFIMPDAMVIMHEKAIIDAAMAVRMATMAYELDGVTMGALAGYGSNYRELGRLAARHVQRILAGTPPRDLPVEMVSRVGFVINLKTAKTLGLIIPPSILARADEVIE